MAADQVIIVPLGGRSPPGTPPPPPVEQEELFLNSSSYSGNENTLIQFLVVRNVETTDRVSVDWVLTGITNATPLFGTVILEVGEVQKATTIDVGEASVTEIGQLTLSNPQNLDGGDTPLLISPSTATFTVIDTSVVVNNQTLRDAGYLLVDDFGAVGDGVTDDTAAIQACINTARDVTQAIWFSRSKVYLISAPLRCFTWDEEGTNPQFRLTEPPQLFGGGIGLTRPIIKLANNAPLFQNVNDPHPLLCFRQFQEFDPSVSGPRPDPADVMDDTGTAESQANNFFSVTLQNVRIDCNQQPGAMGVYFPSAQRCFAADIEVDATGAAVGWEGALGRNSPITNLKIIGGREQFICSARLSKDGSNGMSITGLELVPDSNTITPFKGPNDAVPVHVTGFRFTSNGFNGSWVDVQNAAGSVRGCVALLHGEVDGGNLFVDNSVGKSIYLRDIYLTNIDDLVQSGSLSTISDTSIRKRINEYVYVDQSPISAGSADYARDVLVDGSLLTQSQPLTDISSNVSIPTVDFIAEHTIDIHRIDDGRPYVDIANYITPFVGNSLGGNFFYTNNNIDVSEPDALSALQQAIQDASTAGHNRVFMPRGAVFVGAQLDLLPHTKMFGMSATYSRIGVKDTWQPTSNIAVVRTANDPDGTCHWSELAISTRRWDPPPAPTAAPARQFDNFDWIQWRTGKFSSSIQREIDLEVGLAENFTGDHQFVWFTDNGGGKHFGLTDLTGRAYYSVDAIGLRIEGTSQPLQIYGYNPEMGKGGPNATEPQTTYSAIIENASNIRIYGSKREGTAHTIKMTNVNNVAHYCGGREHAGYGTTNGIAATRSVLGNSNNFQFVLGGVDQTGQVETAIDYLSYEDTNAFPAVGIKFPRLCVLHRRGTLDDNIMLLGSGPPPPPSNQAPVIVGIVTPIFEQGTPGEYDLDQHMSDPDGDALTVIFNSVTFPDGVTVQSLPNDNKLIYDGVGAVATSFGHNIKAFDGELESTPSADFTIEIATTVSIPITGVTFNLASVRNVAPGNGVFANESDNWPIAHHANGHQYTSFGDGQGFKNLPGNQLTRGSFGFSRIEGGKDTYSAFDVFKSGEAMPGEQGKCYGLLAANGKLYAAVDYFLVGGSGSREDRYHGLSLISSANEGASWTEEIRWDAGDWGPNQLNGFYSMAFVQYGQDHSGPRSPLADPLYVYAIVCEHDDDNYECQIPGGISLMRCLASNLETGNKNHWEYVSGIGAGNVPTWSTNITDRIMTFQNVTDGNDSSSISYNAPLGRYVLTTFHNTRNTGPTNNDCFIGIYEAPEPWGPWTEVLNTNVQTLGLATGSAVIYWDFSNKWLSSDGRSFVMVGTLPGQDEWGSIEGTFETSTGGGGFVFPEEHFPQVSVNPGPASLSLPANSAMLAIGMSNTNQYIAELQPLANPTSKTFIVNGAQGGAAAAQWAISGNQAWTNAAQTLSNAGFTANQVSVVFIGMVDRVNGDPVDVYTARLDSQLRQVVLNVRSKYPNAIMIMNGLHNEFWANSHPEPHAWWSSTLTDAIVNDEPDVYWGPYIWNPIGGRSGDGFNITEADHQPNGNVHLTQAGSLKVAQSIMTWFQTDSVGQSIFF